MKYNYQTPTRLIFGKGVIENLPKVLKKISHIIFFSIFAAANPRFAT